MWNAGLDDSQTGIKISRRNFDNLREVDDNHSNGRKRTGTKESTDEGEWGEWKAGLKFSIEINKIMASSPITSWKIEGGKVEAMADFIFLGSKITVDVDYSHGINEMTLATWNETYYKLGFILKAEASLCRQSFV